MNIDLKKDLRKKMRQVLTEFPKSLSPEQKTSLSKNLCQKVTSLPQYKDADLIFAYIPDKLEADCIPIILDAIKNKKKVCVPKVDLESIERCENQMDFYFIDENKELDEQLATGAYGIREPKPELKKFYIAKLDEMQSKQLKSDSANLINKDDCSCSPSLKNFFMLVPGVAFTKDGKRLGHGKGFYDIYIERLKKAGCIPFLCGICLPCQLVENLPTEGHDILMDAVVFADL